MTPDMFDWNLLIQEFERFETEKDLRRLAPHFFVRALIRPLPEFVEPFLSVRLRRAADRGEAVRDLYGFLVEKRYYEKMNLLYFVLRSSMTTPPCPRRSSIARPCPTKGVCPVSDTAWTRTSNSGWGKRPFEERGTIHSAGSRDIIADEVFHENEAAGKDRLEGFRDGPGRDPHHPSGL
jgi:hypothetical protein